ncbi:xylulokinase [Tardisphaera saccharovorans]
MNVSPPYYLGVDIGTTGAKVILVDVGGYVVAEHVEEYPLYTPKLGWTEQEPEDWWAAVKRALSSFWAQGIKPDDIEGIGLTGQMHGLVSVDLSFKPIRRAILWNDQRTGSQASEMAKKLGLDRIIRITGSYPHTGFTAPKLLWLKENEPSNYARVSKFMLPKDYIGLKLTGKAVTDVNDASGTSLFDVSKRSWSHELIGELDISEDVLPDVMESPSVRGEVTAKVSEETGLRAGTPVVAGAGDQGAAGVGSGAVREGIGSINVGTSGVVFSSSDSYRYDRKGRLHSFCHAVPGKWHVMGVMLAAGGSLRWFRDTLGEPERTTALLAGLDVYDIITQEASLVQPGSEGVIFLPYLSGERTPHGDPDARGVFFGLSLKHTKRHMARAVLEGVAYGLRDSFELMTAMGVTPSEFRIMGGGSKSPLWRKIIADVFGRPIYTMEVDEGSSYGAAILGAVGAGAFSRVEDAVKAMVKTKDFAEADAENHRIYDAWYQLYRSLYPSLKDEYKKASQIITTG